MNQTTVIVSAAIVGVVFLVLAALAVGVGGTTVTVTESGSHPTTRTAPIDPPADGSHGVLISTHESSPGWNIFGWQVRQPRYVASVAVVPPPGCDVEQDDRLVRDGPCAGALVEGDVSGNGTSFEGVEFVIISFGVSSDCYEALEDGVTWPTPHEACS